MEGDAGEVLDLRAEGRGGLFRGPGFDVGDAVEAADLDGGVGFVDDGPGGVFRAFPELVVIRLGGREKADRFAQGGDGSCFGEGEGVGRCGGSEIGHGFGEEAGELRRRGRAIGVDEDVVDGEAAALVELADVGGGEGGGRLWIVEDEGDAEALAVADDLRVRSGLFGEGADGVVVSVDDEDVGGGEPVVGEIVGGFDQAGEGGGKR